MMKRRWLPIVSLLVLSLAAPAAVFAAPAQTAAASASARPAAAARCHDAKGKFVKCPAAAAVKPKQCRGPSGKFVKCPS